MSDGATSAKAAGKRKRRRARLTLQPRKPKSTAKPPQPEPLYELKRILRARRTEAGTEYLIDWAGTNRKGRPWRPTWQPEGLVHAPEAVAEWKTRHTLGCDTDGDEATAAGGDDADADDTAWEDVSDEDCASSGSEGDQDEGWTETESGLWLPSAKMGRHPDILDDRWWDVFGSEFGGLLQTSSASSEAEHVVDRNATASLIEELRKIRADSKFEGQEQYVSLSIGPGTRVFDVVYAFAGPFLVTYPPTGEIRTQFVDLELHRERLAFLRLRAAKLRKVCDYLVRLETAVHRRMEEATQNPRIEDPDVYANVLYAIRPGIAQAKRQTEEIEAACARREEAEGGVSK